MIRLLSADFDDPEITQDLLEDLRSELEAAGLGPSVVGNPHEPRRVRLRKSVEPGAAVDAVLVVLGDVREAVVAGVAWAVWRWAKRRGPFRRRRGGRPVAVIWGPNGEVLREVDLSQDEDPPAAPSR